MGDVNLGMKGQHHEASGLTTLGCGGGFVEMVSPVSITSGLCRAGVLQWARTWKICLGNCWEREPLQGQQGK